MIKTILTTFITSSNLSAMRWDAGPPPVLRVTFKAGTTYLFRDVPEQVANAFAEAESAGKYFAAHIKGKYPSEKESAS